MVNRTVDKVPAATVMFQTFETVSARAVAVRFNRNSFKAVNAATTRSYWIGGLLPDIRLRQSRILELKLEEALIGATKFFDIVQSRVFVIRLWIGASVFRFGVVVCIGPILTSTRIVLEHQVVSILIDSRIAI